MANCPDLLDALRRFHLLDDRQLDELRHKLQGKTIEPRTLAQKLMEQGWLTPYQVNQLLQGRAQQLLLGSYVLLERLGAGGMGEVFRARNWKLGKVVAIKLIRKERLANAVAVKRFRREAQAAAQLAHPNVVHAYDADEVGGTHLFVMEYVEGTDLNKLVKDKGPLSVEAACKYVQQAALGLQHAHERGLVHRDIKPHNLVLSSAGVVKILDLGLARIADDNSGTLTQEGSVMGTLDYLAPEQARDAHSADIRADLYALGCTFHYLLTGQVLFPGGTASEKMWKHAFDEPTPVDKLRVDVPSGVAAVIRKLLAKGPEERFQTPAELAVVLAKGAAIPLSAVQTRPSAALRERASSPVPLALPVKTDNTIAAGTPPPEAQQASKRRRLLLLSTVGVALAGPLILIFGIYLLFGDNNSKTRLITAGRLKPTESRPHAGLGYSLTGHPAESVEFKGHWYAYYPGKFTWPEAKTRCQEMGGYLACIRTTEEQQFVVKLTNGSFAWLGGFTDNQKKWFWVTGEPITDFYWARGQPDFHMAQGQPSAFLQLMPTYPGFVGIQCWGDITPSELPRFPAGFLCEWEF